MTFTYVSIHGLCLHGSSRINHGMKMIRFILRAIRSELTNNLAKLSELDDRILPEKKKLEEAEGLDEFTQRRLAERLQNLQDERGA